METQLSEISTVDLKTAKQVITNAMKYRHPVIIQSSTSINQTDLISQIDAEAKNRLVINISLSQQNPITSNGASLLAEFPSGKLASKYDRIILFLNDMGSATTIVRDAMYHLIINGKVGTYTLPDNTAIVATGNHENNSILSRLPAPIKNRFNHINMSNSLDNTSEFLIFRPTNV